MRMDGSHDFYVEVFDTYPDQDVASEAGATISEWRCFYFGCSEGGANGVGGGHGDDGAPVTLLEGELSALLFYLNEPSLQPIHSEGFAERYRFTIETSGHGTVSIRLDIYDDIYEGRVPILQVRNEFGLCWEGFTGAHYYTQVLEWDLVFLLVHIYEGAGHLGGVFQGEPTESANFAFESLDRGLYTKVHWVGRWDAHADYPSSDALSRQILREARCFPSDSKVVRSIIEGQDQ